MSNDKRKHQDQHESEHEPPPAAAKDKRRELTAEDFRPWETGKSAVGDPAGRDQGA